MYNVLKSNLEEGRFFYFFIEEDLGLRLSLGDKMVLIRTLSEYDHTCFVDLWDHVIIHLGEMGHQYDSKKFTNALMQRQRTENEDFFLGMCIS
ncbi:hypothetical protein J4477_02870 [Candidatus Pacearchaeota archaeon]|nr:hypothetical protein [Candidatus Pacearchaeota archaeon]